MKTEIIITSPTGLGLRNDQEGLGHYGAPRGKRKHRGYDFLCTPGQDVVCPVEFGKIIRVAYPDNDTQYLGVEIRGPHISIKLFYCDPWLSLIGKWVKRGETIAIAQDVSNKYGKKMKPHVHLRITSIDPEMLIKQY